MSSNRRKSVRRAIGYGAAIVAPDGAWTRKCRVVDISESGAKLALEEPGELPKAFVLMLSERGGPKRRCHVVWETGEQLGVEFERPKKAGAAA
ncbi:MAG: PilZ domain-containing protein [Alphaproteobacteria bacterium]